MTERLEREGIVPAPEPSHAMAAAIEEALRLPQMDG
jgi:predicted alternative tryptophan synthase beta-subunit